MVLPLLGAGLAAAIKGATAKATARVMLKVAPAIAKGRAVTAGAKTLTTFQSMNAAKTFAGSYNFTLRTGKIMEGGLESRAGMMASKNVNAISRKVASAAMPTINSAINDHYGSKGFRFRRQKGRYPSPNALPKPRYSRPPAFSGAPKIKLPAYSKINISPRYSKIKFSNFSHSPRYSDLTLKRNTRINIRYGGR